LRIPHAFWVATLLLIVTAVAGPAIVWVAMSAFSTGE
jgi:hypothetical protein